MSAENQSTTTYQELIKEAYLDPIRTAVLIDDDFPMFDEYLSNQVTTGKKTDILAKLLTTCRGNPNYWLVDVHNGKVNASSEESKRYSHLHHSDLMILDYHLDGDDTNDKALKILRSLASNSYFNLVVVYTNGTEAELQTRVLEIVQGLTFNLYGSTTPEIPKDISDWENDKDDITKTLKSSLSTDAILFLMQDKNIENTGWKDKQEFSALFDMFSTRQKDIKRTIDTNLILAWLVKEWIISSRKPFANDNFGRVDFTVHKTSNMTNWIRTDNLFITVIAKSIEPSEIPHMLLNALEASAPSPHRLLMSKMRNCLDDSGVGAEASIVRKGNVQAALLWQMLHAQANELPWRLQETIERHWEQLATAIESDIHSYGMRLFKTVLTEHGTDKNTGIKKYTTVDFSKGPCKEDATDEINSFICSRKPSGVHLMPGQIFFVADNENRKTYWICLSPACDLVPAQNKGKWPEKNIMQFTALKLWPNSSKLDSQSINTNDYLFIEVDGKVSRFCYRSDPKSSPVWEQFFALENGVTRENKIKFLSIHQYDDANTKMESAIHEAVIVSQLRYEYAINLMQKLGTNLTRVGLDFISIN